MRRKFITEKTLTVKNGQLAWTLTPRKFDGSEIAQLIEKLESDGYTMESLEDGVCGYGKFVMWAPDEKHYSFIVREEALNCWTSVHTIERFTTIYPELRAEMDECLKMQEEAGA